MVLFRLSFLSCVSSGNWHDLGGWSCLVHFDLIRLEFADERLVRKTVVWNHVIATNLRPILDLLEHVLRVARAVVKEELLHSSRLILMLNSRLAREQTDCTELVANDECLAIAAELAVERVVALVAIY